MAKLKKWLIGAVSLLSMIAGAFYINGHVFGFQFLGPEIGSERDTVLFWSRISIGLGIILLVTLVLRPRMKAKVNDGMLIMLLGLLFLIQLPPVSLWLLGAIAGNWSAAAAGIVTHGLLLAAIVRIVTMGRGKDAAH
ncbi:hypothetical protein [Paenibacillus arenilitoris]|uniref:Uncharacterized protein n=1 Tax=Paenibacillus arenilitoris TaxID=2772299 RepID=A0A927H8P2_9BACL|nr:hypothetical protein [Paenibacillus arenilitoris]MBD2872956.1 hypothetical protein [Paenibacillus arenilitoris]